MDKDLFNENIKNAFDGFEADPPEFVLDRIKSTYQKQQKVSRTRSYLKGALVVSIVALLSIPIYYFIPNENTPKQITSNSQSQNVKSMTIDNSSSETIEETTIPENKLNKSKSITVFAGEDDVTCGLIYELNSKVNSDVLGIWKVVDSDKADKVKFDNRINLNTVVKVSKPGKYSFVYEVVSDGIKVFDDVSIEFVDLSLISAGKDNEVCELNCIIESNGETGSWFSLNGSEIFTPENNKSIVKVAKAGVYSFVWKETRLSCISFDTVNIEFVESSGLKLNVLSNPLCSYDDVIFSGVFNPVYNSKWDFDGGTQQYYNGFASENEEKQIVNWDKGGSHNVVLTVSHKYCVDKAEVEVNLKERIFADYMISDPGEDVPAMVYFSNITNVGDREYNRFDDIEFEWNFGDGETSSEQNPDHLYLYPGIFNPVLIAKSLIGCSDTIKGRSIKLGQDISGKQANIFTPNNDGENDIFRVNTANLKSFKCIILTRSSEKIFEWTDPASGWDGRIRGGQLASQGMYYYIIRGEGFDGKPVEIPGIVYLIK